MNFMSRGKKIWTPFPHNTPYDEIVFPHDAHVKEGVPNKWAHKIYDSTERTVESVTDSIDPADEELKRRVNRFMDICLDV